jgi:hypothetical protein
MTSPANAWGHWWAAYPRPASRNGTASKGYHERPATVSPKRPRLDENRCVTQANRGILAMR